MLKLNLHEYDYSASDIQQLSTVLKNLDQLTLLVRSGCGAVSQVLQGLPLEKLVLNYVDQGYQKNELANMLRRCDVSRLKLLALDVGGSKQVLDECIGALNEIGQRESQGIEELLVFKKAGETSKWKKVSWKNFSRLKTACLIDYEVNVGEDFSVIDDESVIELGSYCRNLVFLRARAVRFDHEKVEKAVESHGPDFELFPLAQICGELFLPSATIDAVAVAQKHFPQAAKSIAEQPGPVYSLNTGFYMG